jgi:aminoglycoside phosphotransferase (APT) family kinase protein
VGDRAGLARTPRTISRSFLERVLVVPTGGIEQVSVVDEHHGTTARARLALAYRRPDMGPPTVFVKVTPTALIERLFHNVMGLGEREVKVFRQLDALRPVRPAIYGAEWDGARGRSLLVMEDLAPDGEGFGDLLDPVSPDQAERVVRALAVVHRPYWETPRFATDLSWLCSPTNRSLHLGPAISDRLLRRGSPLADEIVPAHTRRAASVLVDRSAEITAAWRALPSTVLHGDTHRGNIHLHRDGERVRLFDWQVSGRGPAEQDLAYFLVTSMTPADRAASELDLLSVYRSALAAGGGPTLDPQEMWLRYRATASRAYVAAMVTATFGARLQAGDIPRVGLQRAAQAMDELDTFAAVRELIDG